MIEEGDTRLEIRMNFDVGSYFVINYKLINKMFHPALSEPEGIIW